MSEQLVETQPVLVPLILRWFHILEVVEAWVLVEVVQVVGRQVILLLAQEVMVTVLVEEATVLVVEATVLVEEAMVLVEARAIQLEVRVIHMGVQALHLVDQVIHLEAVLPVLLAHLVQVVREEVEVGGILICMVDPARVGL